METLMEMNFFMPARIITGKGCIMKNADLLKAYGNSCLIVTGKSSAKKCGALDDITKALAKEDISYIIYDKITENPRIDHCHEAGSLARDFGSDFIIGIGDNAVRKKIAEKFDVNWVTLIHPSAQIAVNASLGKGTAVMAGAVINACTSVGEHCIINTRAVIEHDNIIEDYVHISPNAALGGAVRIGEQTHIGIGATVINNIDICGKCIIGAGAVAIKNIEDFGTYVGVPARKIK